MIKQYFKEKILDSVKNDLDRWNGVSYELGNITISAVEWLSDFPYPYFFKITEKNEWNRVKIYFLPFSKLYWARKKIMKHLDKTNYIDKNKCIINALPEKEKQILERQLKFDRIIKK